MDNKQQKPTESSDETFHLLKHIEILQDLTEAEIKIIISALKQEEYKENDTIFTEGSVGTKLFIIKSGTVDVIKKMHMWWGIEENKLARLKEGDFFGELSLFDNQPRSSTIRAFSSCTVFCMEKSDFDKIINKNPAIGIKIFRRIIQKLSQRLRSADNTIRDLSIAVLHY